MSAASPSVKSVLGRPTVHPFPARMAPCVALDALTGCTSSGRLRICDPMVGSGTSLAIAQLNGHKVFGCDLDPLAVMLSTVWLTPVDASSARDHGSELLDRAKYSFAKRKLSGSFPKDANKATRKFLSYWFDPYTREQLVHLSSAISRVRDSARKNLFYAALSRMIIVKKNGVSLAMDVAHSRPHRVYKRSPRKPFRSFLESLDNVLAGCPSDSKFGLSLPCIQCADARSLPYRKNYFHKIITSPPYLNAIDYIRTSKFSLAWMGYQIDDLGVVRSSSVGSERSMEIHTDRNPAVQDCFDQILPDELVGTKQSKIIYRYVHDLYAAILESYRVLKDGGKASYVIGDANVKNNVVKNSNMIEILAGHVGFEIASREEREIPASRRYLPPPSQSINASSLDSRMKTEAVINLVKR